MIQGATERMAVRPVTEVELLGQSPETIAIRVLVGIIVGPLPTDKLLGHRIDALVLPLAKLFGRKIRTQVVPHQHPKQFDLTQTTTEIVAAQGTGIGPVLDGRFFAALVAGHPLLENIHALIEQ